MTTAKQAEDFVQKYYRQVKGVELIKVPKGERGYDFRDENSNLFVEVKGATKSGLNKISFRYFTNDQLEKAKACRKSKKKYIIHLVTGIGTNSIEHYSIPGQILIEEGNLEVRWCLHLRQEHKKYKIN